MVGQILDETSVLRTVLLGIARDKGPPAPTTEQAKEALDTSTYPTEPALVRDMARLGSLLRREGINVLRPPNRPGLTQIFTRDIGFLIGTTLVQANMQVGERQDEWAQVHGLLGDYSPLKIDHADAWIEGGDIVLADRQIFVGTGNRTNTAGLNWLKERFPCWTVHEVPLNPWTLEKPDPHGVLHLDCAFQPVGQNSALLYRKGLQKPEVIEEVFGRDSIIELKDEEKFALAANVLSLSPTKVVSESGAHRINMALAERGFQVLPIQYSSVMKLGGLFRCSTLPLDRHLS